MTLHAFAQYLLYRWKAKGRHGIHSPFVYAFIEDGIQKTEASSLEELLISYFDRTILFERVNAAAGKFKAAGDDTMIAVRDIHVNRKATEEWNRLSSDPKVRLSIDLFEYGLLFFDEAFKQKQHFVVKYPA